MSTHPVNAKWCYWQGVGHGMGSLLLTALLALGPIPPATAQTAGSTRQIARLRADLQVCDENVRKLAAAIELLQQRNAELTARVAATDQSLKNLLGRLQTVQNGLAKERTDRDAAMKQLTETVTAEVQRMLGQLRTTRSPAARGAVQGEYSVVRGDTLGAIAKAFGVSIDSLKQANDLQNDMIRVGQKLLIPAP